MRALQFDSPRDEYRYELDRNDSYRMLVPLRVPPDGANESGMKAHLLRAEFPVRAHDCPRPNVGHRRARSDLLRCNSVRWARPGWRGATVMRRSRDAAVPMSGFSREPDAGDCDDHADERESGQRFSEQQPRHQRGRRRREVEQARDIHRAAAADQ